MALDSENTSPMNRDSLIADLFDRWKDAQERGECLSVDDLCRMAPEMKAELHRRIDGIEHRRAPFLQGDTNADSGSDDEILKTISEITSLTFHARGGLGADLLNSTEIGPLCPGSQRTEKLRLSTSTAAVGIMGEFTNYGEMQTSRTVPLEPGVDREIYVVINGTGVQLQ